MFIFLIIYNFCNIDTSRISALALMAIKVHKTKGRMFKKSVICLVINVGWLVHLNYLISYILTGRQKYHQYSSYRQPIPRQRPLLNLAITGPVTVHRRACRQVFASFTFLSMSHVLFVCCKHIITMVWYAEAIAHYYVCSGLTSSFFLPG